jgi:hypothetical protein
MGAHWDAREVYHDTGTRRRLLPARERPGCNNGWGHFGSGVQDRPGHNEPVDGLSYREGCCTFDQGVTGHDLTGTAEDCTAQHNIA